MIQTYNLTKKYGDFTAVSDVNLDIKRGQIFVLLGPNGAGKTTTVRMLTSILRPTSGKALVGGYDVVNDAQNVRATVGVLTEHHGLYSRMKAEEYLEFFSRLYNLKPAEFTPRIQDLLIKFGLDDAKNKRLGEFSKGMRQKLSLVRALMHQPQVLLLDEPTSAMDPQSSRMVRDSILNLKSGDRTVVLCTHNLAEAEELADQVAIIQKGKIIVNDTPARLKEKLLGPAQFDAVLAESFNGQSLDLPSEVKIIQKNDNSIRFEIKDPQQSNPLILQNMLEQKMKVVSFKEVPTTLEQAYLAAVKLYQREEKSV